MYLSVALKGPFLHLRFSEQVIEIGMENLGVLWYTADEDNKWAFTEKYTFPLKRPFTVIWPFRKPLPYHER